MTDIMNELSAAIKEFLKKAPFNAKAVVFAGPNPDMPSIAQRFGLSSDREELELLLRCFAHFQPPGVSLQVPGDKLGHYKSLGLVSLPDNHFVVFGRESLMAQEVAEKAFLIDCRLLFLASKAIEQFGIFEGAWEATDRKTLQIAKRIARRAETDSVPARSVPSSILETVAAYLRVRGVAAPVMAWYRARLGDKRDKTALQRAEQILCQVRGAETTILPERFIPGVILGILAGFVSLGTPGVPTKVMNWYKARVRHRYVSRLLRST